MARERRVAEARYRHDLKPVAELRARATELLRAIKRSRRPVVLTEGGVPQGVLLDVATYSALRETALLLEVLALGRRSVRLPRLVRKRRAASRR